MSPAATPRPARSAVLLTHTHPEQTSDAVRATIAAAAAAGCRLHGPSDELAKHGEAATGLEPLSELEREPDVCIVIGGDGTILRALGTYAGTAVPVFGVNFGTVGFLAAIEREELAGGIERALAGDFEVMSMPGLEAGIEGDQVRLSANGDAAVLLEEEKSGAALGED